MKSVLISIQPKWIDLIASRKKTVEIRKTRPKLETPFKCYIYCTADMVKHIVFDEYGDRQIELVPRRVIGEFVCDEIKRVHFVSLAKETICALAGGNGDSEWYEGSCISYIDAYRYLQTAKKAYGWHIYDLKIYDTPLELSNFFLACDKPSDSNCSVCEESGKARCKQLRRPPQSWCYVMEV